MGGYRLVRHQEDGRQVGRTPNGWRCIRMPDDEGFVLPTRAVGDGDLIARFRRALQIVDEVSGQFSDGHLRTACRQALSEIGVELFSGPLRLSPDQAALGVCCAVARANHALTPIDPGRTTAGAAHLGMAGLPTGAITHIAHLLDQSTMERTSRSGGPSSGSARA